MRVLAYVDGCVPRAKSQGRSWIGTLDARAGASRRLLLDYTEQTIHPSKCLSSSPPQFDPFLLRTTTMSSAHRPTWTPAQGKGDNRHVTRVTGVRELPSQTTLKYRQAQGDQGVPPSNDFGEETREQLKARLARAEKDARNKKRKAQGLEPEPESASEEEEAEDEEVEEPEFKKPRTIEREFETSLKGKSRAAESETQPLDQGDESDAVEVDEDDEEDDEEIEARARAILKAQGGNEDGSEEEDESSGSEDEDDDDEDETAQLMKELEKIKAERAAAAAQKAREEEETKEKREEEIAKGNPLLNDGIKDKEAFTDDGSSSVASFGVKRRWDDGECALLPVPQGLVCQLIQSISHLQMSSSRISLLGRRPTTRTLSTTSRGPPSTRNFSTAISSRVAAPL